LRALEEARGWLEEWDRRLSGGDPDFEVALEKLRRSRVEARRRDALAPVAGGLGVAALDPGDD
jgi:hypothetical protein